MRKYKRIHIKQRKIIFTRQMVVVKDKMLNLVLEVEMVMVKDMVVGLKVEV